MLSIGLSFLLLTAFALTLAWQGALAGPGFAHTVLAAGALPLMLAAIIHFVPVLTRSRGAPGGIRALPALAMASGAFAAATLALAWPRVWLVIPAALIGSIASVVALWAVKRIRAAFGPAHPSARWYVASLGFLLLAMLAVAGLLLDGAHYGFWRNLHLHANLFGWVALTALGTLPVLLPTVLREAQPSAVERLRRHLPTAATGVLAIAVGAAGGWSWLGAVGALLLGFVVLAHLRAWLLTYGARLGQGAAASLALATGFLFLILAVGALHGFGALSAANLLPAYVFGFLLPLVLGALAQLLPVWRFAGPETPQRSAFAKRLASRARLRAMLCLAAAALQVFDQAWGPLLAAVAVLHFVGTLVLGWRARPMAGV